MRPTFGVTPPPGRHVDYVPVGMPEAEARLAERMAAVESTSVAWRTAAMDALRDIADVQAELTAEDVWEELARRGIPSPAEKRSMGPVMVAAVKLGIIEPIGTTRRGRVFGNVGLTTRYRSLVRR